MYIAKCIVSRRVAFHFILMVDKMGPFLCGSLSDYVSVFQIFFSN